MERRQHRKVIVFRPLYAVGGQELGYLPGTENEKMGPWAQAVFDTLEGLVSTEVIDEVLSRGMLEVLPLTHIRGRSLAATLDLRREIRSRAKRVGNGCRRGGATVHSGQEGRWHDTGLPRRKPKHCCESILG